MVTKRAVVQNRAGIHIRPSGVIMQALQGYPGEVRLSTETAETKLDSVMSLIALGLFPGDWVEVSVSGPDEVEVCDRLVALFEKHFDFPPKS